MTTEEHAALKKLLDERAALYNTPAFIPTDPISIPHSFSKQQDVEIAGLFAATLAWGHRSIIIRNSRQIMEWMDGAPHQFILQHQDVDLKPMLSFRHRTFNATDLLYFIQFLRHHYERHDSLEAAFLPKEAVSQTSPEHALAPSSGSTATVRRDAMHRVSTPTIQQSLLHFHNYFFSLPEFPERTRKHVSTPARGSACKRLCMYLRWMVRQDDQGVDFGLWRAIRPANLVCPLDLHVARVSRRLGLLHDEKSNWRNAEALTAALRAFDPEDPVRYDFALFGLGAEERM